MGDALIVSSLLLSNWQLISSTVCKRLVDFERITILLLLSPISCLSISLDISTQHSPRHAFYRTVIRVFEESILPLTSLVHCKLSILGGTRTPQRATVWISIDVSMDVMHQHKIWTLISRGDTRDTGKGQGKTRQLLRNNSLSRLTCCYSQIPLLVLGRCVSGVFAGVDVVFD
jgi:hypothetical protein